MAEFKTPMLRQYQEIKDQYPDCLLFFRLGDFYELFGDDAKIGSEVLHITLTARDKGSDGKIPMCGVPYHASENYVARLVQAGYKVAICEQMTPATEGKGIVKREVVRVVTAGTLLRDESLTDPGASFLVSLTTDKNSLGGAAVDLSTGECFAFEFSGLLDDILPMIMSHFGPRECVVPRSLYENKDFMNLLRRDHPVNMTCAHDWLIYTQDASQILKQQFAVTSLDAFGLTKKLLAQKALAALLGYLRYTQKSDLAHITSIKEFHFNGYLVLDHTTLTHLEIMHTREGDREGSLFATLNATTTSAGQRMLAQWLTHPITNRQVLDTRHDSIDEFLARPKELDRLRAGLGQLSDMERLVGRLSVGLGSPRDLRRLLDTLFYLETELSPQFLKLKQPHIRQLAQAMSSDLKKLVVELRHKTIEEAKPTLDEGGIFSQGWHDELDQLRDLATGNQTWLAEFEANERDRTSIAKLKVVYSRAFGYAIEIPRTQKDKVPVDYVPRQTLVNAERYTKEELAVYERQALSAFDRMVALEKTLFSQVTAEIVACAAPIAEIAGRYAELDVLTSLAHTAKMFRYSRPVLKDEPGIAIKGGRHPVIEQINREAFVDNDTTLKPAKSFQLITGPNMAGKSTYIRQVALIALLAHTGSFVPAKAATIGLVDRIFTRIGAHDNLRAGQSTFMVEMLETAHILHNATPKSLIILDEVGRGTSPEDGFALAHAIAEALAHKQSLVLFATHFHDLKVLADQNPTIFNSHLAVAVDEDDLIFLRKVVSGPTDQSYGILVAEKAGVPATIIRRAKDLTKQNPKIGKTINNPQIPLFVPIQTSVFEQQLKALDLSDITPLEALNKLAEWQASLKKKTN